MPEEESPIIIPILQMAKEGTGGNPLLMLKEKKRYLMAQITSYENPSSW